MRRLNLTRYGLIGLSLATAATAGGAGGYLGQSIGQDIGHDIWQSIDQSIGQFIGTATAAPARPSVKLAWSHYTGWEPWGYIQAHKIAQQEIEKSCGAGAKIEISLINDYSESLTQYTAGSYDGVAVTNMDALAVPAVGGKKTEMLVVSDYSDGNDAVISGDPKVKTLANLKGKKLNLEQLTVSQYLLARGLEGAGMSEKDLTLVNTSDADMGSIYQSRPNALVVTWNPIVRSIHQADPKAKDLFTSHQIPGEIIDAMAVRSDLDPCAKTAIKAAWWQTMASLRASLTQTTLAIGAHAIAKDKGDSSELKETPETAMMFELAKQAGGSIDDLVAQMATTHFFWTPTEANLFVTSSSLPQTMKYVRDFSFAHGIFGDLKDPGSVAIEFPDGRILGDEDHIMIVYPEQR